MSSLSDQKYADFVQFFMDELKLRIRKSVQINTVSDEAIKYINLIQDPWMIAIAIYEYSGMFNVRVYNLESWSDYSTGYQDLKSTEIGINNNNQGQSNRIIDKILFAAKEVNILELFFVSVFDTMIEFSVYSEGEIS